MPWKCYGSTDPTDLISLKWDNEWTAWNITEYIEVKSYNHTLKGTLWHLYELQLNDWDDKKMHDKKVPS